MSKLLLRRSAENDGMVVKKTGVVFIGLNDTESKGCMLYMVDNTMSLRSETNLVVHGG
jgi:hypothetical protein